MRLNSDKSAEFTMKLPNLLTNDLNDQIRHTMMNVNKANIYGVKLSDLPFLSKSIKRYSRQFKSRKEKYKNTNKMM